MARRSRLKTGRFHKVSARCPTKGSQGSLGSLSLAVDEVIVSFHGGSPLNRIGGLDSNESGLNRRINIQLLSGHPPELP